MVKLIVFVLWPLSLFQRVLFITRRGRPIPILNTSTKPWHRWVSRPSLLRTALMNMATWPAPISVRSWPVIARMDKQRGENVIVDHSLPSSERAEDVMAMFKDPSVKMIVANRGGWGCNRFIDMVLLRE